MRARLAIRFTAALLASTLTLAGVGLASAQTGSTRPATGNPQTAATLTIDQAVEAARTFVARFGDPDLRLDEAMEFERNFYVTVEEQSTGIGAFELLVDKATGEVFPEFGPDMMWNTKYGHMAGVGYGMMGGYGHGYGMMGGYGHGYGMTNGSWPTSGGMMRGYGGNAAPGSPGAGSGYGGTMGNRGPTAPTAAPTVTADQATQIAQRWLDANQPGSATEAPDAFYGYYTLHLIKDGTVTGMLSVNAYSGQVWYHTWHGAFIQMRELAH